MQLLLDLGKMTTEAQAALVQRLKAELGQEVTMVEGRMPRWYADLQNGEAIALVWNVEDVRQMRPDLTTDEAAEVLSMVYERHDASFGVNWEVLTDQANTLFPVSQVFASFPEAKQKALRAVAGRVAAAGGFCGGQQNFVLIRSGDGQWQVESDGMVLMEGEHPLTVTPEQAALMIEGAEPIGQEDYAFIVPSDD